jgi:hypothetical protein
MDGKSRVKSEDMIGELMALRAVVINRHWISHLRTPFAEKEGGCV